MMSIGIAESTIQKTRSSRTFFKLEALFDHFEVSEGLYGNFPSFCKIIKFSINMFRNSRTILETIKQIF